MKKITWITGASSGIGLALTKKILAIGDITVLATARRPELITSDFGNVIPSQLMIDRCDVSSTEDIKKISDRISNSGDFINCLINNAGMTSFSKAETDSPELIKKIIDTNLTGAIFAAKAVLPMMIARNEGIIVNILSVVTEKIFTESSAYSASKAGLKAYMDVLREEVRKYNIRVINVIPGATETPIWPENVLSKHAQKMMKSADLAEMLLNVINSPGNIVAESIVLRPVTGDL